MGDSRNDVLAGRSLVEEYRQAHERLHQTAPASPAAPSHAPLLAELTAGLESLGYSSLGEFQEASDRLNLEEMGFDSREQFNAEMERLNEGAPTHPFAGEGEPYQVEGSTDDALALLSQLEGRWK